MIFAHKAGFIHRDLKPKNFLIDKAFRAAVGDFGLVISSGTSTQTGGGTPAYYAPEVLKATGSSSEMVGSQTAKADVYAFGVSVWETVTGQVPFFDQPQFQIAMGVMIHGKRAHGEKWDELMAAEDQRSPFFGELVKDCWAQEPEDRPTFSEIKARFATVAELTQFLPPPPKQPTNHGTKRLALVIANSNYTRSAYLPLKNTIADGEDMVSALEKHGFVVVSLYDANRDQMTEAIRQFVKNITDEKFCTSFFFFAGHGKEVRQDGENYLLPVDYQPPAAGTHQRESDKAICLNDGLIAELNGVGCRHPDTLNIVMLDCCREDSTNDTFRGVRRGSDKGSDSGSVSRGARNLRACPTSSENTSEFLVAFGSLPGTACIEYPHQRNGVFTGAFLEVLKKHAKLPVESFFREVTKVAFERSDRKQKPCTHQSGLMKRFCFAQ
jgi:hypothetical protein